MKKAYDVLMADIREMEAADVTPARHWRSVKDRLPENNERVLAWCKDCCIHDVVWKWPEYVWFDKVTGAEYMEKFVTRWLPLLPPFPWEVSEE